ncbi:MAG: archaeal proteasome endopeptidase complex subunit alpha [Nitrososphaerota archaeon]|jgi:proteasome alpha subunit|nr:archaeal proteasome endopeptidase complex subunit alpha [Nitrososphaerota archaeon]MDG6927343.1 archaeal proteasome endopeptidase complex subunit alpha [Nitrososphaerota archaeon]MDG6930929.1 archaeal proteasome endopeptidase complex subunit alpha [Nitrososphaerota archaeon]MDG6932229.1 archaeal proteasome endopeptidase complex subunit alpha [Nitrososphaerota archaeon]MDG6935778.1 archaeal proteasome endopeptidase complex subunit alpha [Nitrososphaerota archaeon]
MFAPSAGYDRALTIFSPDGRLYQVEYAIETVRRGTIAIGIKVNGGVVLAVEERIKKLQSSRLSQKIFQVDDHIGIAAAGYVPDARVMVDSARTLAQNNRLLYDEEVEVETISRKLGDLAQQYTQYAGVRPFGVSLIIAGVDKEAPALYSTDPSGTYLEYNAIAIGGGSDAANEYLEQNYKGDAPFEEAVDLALKCILKVNEGKVDPVNVKVATIDSASRAMKMLSKEEVTAKVENLAKEWQA